MAGHGARLLFTCGGTAGHINPAIAVADWVRKRQPDAEILFVGTNGGMETDLAPRAGYEILTIPASSLQHSLKPSAVLHNGRVLRRMARSLREAKKIIRAFHPEAVIGTGGYVCYPVIREAARLGIPTVVHESNVFPGLTTKLLSRKASRILVSFGEAKASYPRPERVALTGTPVGGAFYETTRAEARAALGIKDDKPLLLSYFGSLGARDMNRHMVDFIARGAREDAFHHIHATGKFGWEWMPDAVREAGVALEDHPGLRLTEYIYDMPHAMMAADLLITRAGASTLAELMVAGRPAILVPSPNVAANHQEKNAQVLARRDAAVMLREAECTGGVLLQKVGELLQDKEKRDAMEKEVHGMAVLDATDKIYQIIMELVKAVR